MKVAEYESYAEAAGVFLQDKTIFMDEMTRLYLASKKNRRKW